MNCRPGCAACCIAPSISTPIPRLDGQLASAKPAGVPCWQLDEQLCCRLFGKPGRPAVCGSLQPAPDLCGNSTAQALFILQQLEYLTAPQASNQASVKVTWTPSPRQTAAQ